MSDHSGFGPRERILVVGIGRSGLATCAVLRARGAAVFATDEKPRSQLEAAIAGLATSGVRFVEPTAIDTVLPELTGCVVSPGVPLNIALIRQIQTAHVSVYSEIEVAYRISRAPMVAITGTKGKTTTTALVGAMFRRAGIVTHVGGNIGNALINETFIAQPGDWVIAEVSSFQLESIRSFKPRVATILNLSPDHLDRYHSMDEYTEAKFRIFANQSTADWFVGNLDDPRIAELASGEGAKRIRARAVWFARAPHPLATLYLRDDRILFAPPTGDPRVIDIMGVREIPLRGTHNVSNVLAAVLTGLVAGLNPGPIREAVRDFSPLPHRLTEVAIEAGVRYVDDSKSTNPGSVIAALESFDEPLILIAGGKAKGTNFDALGAAIDARVKALVLVGEAADEIAGAVKTTPIARADSMEMAVDLARSFAQPGDVILLSPGCASFDMFGSADARGDAFVRAATALTGTRG